MFVTLRAGLVLGAAVISFPAVHATAQAAGRLITQRVDDASTVALTGNTRSEAVAANDRGLVADDHSLDHMQILLNRPADREAALTRFLERLNDPRSPDFHRWVTADQYGSMFGPDLADVGDVVAWLQRRGFRVNGVQASRMVIDFSGTAGLVRDSFGAAIHRIQSRGVMHIANMNDPRIPSALAGIVRGIVSLNDFRPHTNFKPRPGYTFTSGSSQYEAVVPADLAKIYNINPLFSEGISGQGQTIVVIEDTDVYKTADWTTFRSVLGLSGYTAGSFVQEHPTGSSACSDPGVVSGSESEAELDAEWASASAPSAAIKLASCSDTSTVFGGLIALQNLVNGAAPPAIVSISYGECEAENGATANAAYNSTYRQAVAEGISVFVSSGDEGAASCDADESYASHGIAVSGFASSPYDVAVGGTDFGDAYAGTVSTYWSTSNSSTYESAKSYVPEIPWNDSCASTLISKTAGYAHTFGASGFCSSATGIMDYLTTAGGSGGPSGCATGAASSSGIVSGSCAGYAKPSWQSLTGVPADKVRDIPDVALFAANGVWGHYYIYCDSDTSDNGAACTGAPSSWSGAGGTSFASPIMAGIQALVNQSQKAKQGNPNPVYYALARSEYAKTGNPCASNRGNTAAGTCTFYDITSGDMDVPCIGTTNCYQPGGVVGVLSTSSSKYALSYGTGVGWDFSTGIGSLNASNLVANWRAGESAAVVASR